MGKNTAALVEARPDLYRVEALTAHSNGKILAEQALRLRPKFVAVADQAAYEPLKQALAGTGIVVAAGPGAVVEAAERPAEWVMSAIVGAAGLAPTLAAVRRGATIGLANKECLVCAGALMMAEVARHGAVILPVDSEHSAIFQVLDVQQIEAVEKIILTASGGPFRTWERQDMTSVTPEQAVSHPNWSMGAKISVDSATMMNKGLEVIEAYHLFGLPEQKIEVLVHPQSVIHSMVAYGDGSVLAQLGTPDMRTPIAYALGWPRRIATSAPRLDLAAIACLTFSAPDGERFPALSLARHALQAGGGAPTVLNAANEIAVQAFLSREIGFLQIADVVEATLEAMGTLVLSSIEDVLATDQEARRQAQDRIREKFSR